MSSRCRPATPRGRSPAANSRRITSASSAGGASSSRTTARSSNGTVAVADRLGRLVALAGDHDDVARAGRAPAATAMAARRSGSTTRSWRGRSTARSYPCLTASMIAPVSSPRELSAVRTTRSACVAATSPIGGPLAGVPVAAAAEDHGHLAPLGRPAHAPGGRQQLLEAVGGVGVVDHDGEGLALVDELEATRHDEGPAEAVGDGRRVEPERPTRSRPPPGRWRR